MAFIQSVATYVPDQMIDIVQLQQCGVLSHDDVQALRAKGIATYPASSENAEKLLFASLDRLIERERISPKEVKYLICTYLSYVFPASHYIFHAIKKRYGFDFAIGFSVRDLLCSSLLMSMYVGNKLANQTCTSENKILVLSVEKCYLPDQRFGGPYFVTGDASGAALIGTRTGDAILAVTQHMNTKNMQTDKFNSGSGLSDLYFFTNLVKALLKGTREAGIGLGDIRLLITNHTLSDIWSVLIQLLRIPPERLYPGHLDEVSHLNNCDLLINYERVMDGDLLKQGDHYALLSLGSGGVAACAICRKG